MNNMLKKIPVVLVTGAFVFLSACSSLSGNRSDNEATTDAAVEDRTNGSQTQDRDDYSGQTDGYDSSNMDQGSAMDGQTTSGGPMANPDSPLSVRTIYFDYDSTTINTEGQSALNAHAEYLSLNTDKRLIIEGHTDEQGTREYNLSLGERRGRSVADFLSASGVPGEQMEVRSYGEENPVALEHNESAWQLNRRVELLY